MNPNAGALWTTVPRRRGRVLSFVVAEPLGALGLVIILLAAATTLLAPWIAPYDPYATDYGAAIQAPSAAHWMGTDSFGRDVLSRVIYGGRTALVIGTGASLLGCTIGLLVGIASAWAGGWIEMVIERFLEVLLAIPITVLALVLVAVSDRSDGGVDGNLIIAIALPIVPKMARVARAQTLAMRRLAWLDAARTLGFSDARIITRHLAPNILGPYLVMLSAFISQAILIEASLSYLGLGVAEPTPSWGLMLAGNAFNTAMTAPWVVVWPGVAIAATVFAFSMLGDSLRDVLDPHYRTAR